MPCGGLGNRAPAREQYVANAASVGAFLLGKLQELLKGQKTVVDVRGRGLMIGVEMETPALRDRIINECFRRGLLVLGAGPSTIRLSPPLMIDQEQATSPPRRCCKPSRDSPYANERSLSHAIPTLPAPLLTFGRRSEIDGIGYLRSIGYRIVTSGYRCQIR
jgi:hypothetical protein